jgi:hypothetical protein
MYLMKKFVRDFLVKNSQFHCCQCFFICVSREILRGRIYSFVEALFCDQCEFVEISIKKVVRTSFAVA